jgi:hypothetical protein
MKFGSVARVAAAARSVEILTRGFVTEFPETNVLSFL